MKYGVMILWISIIFFLMDLILLLYNIMRRRKRSDHARDVNDELLDQMSIVGGLSNAYFSVYSVNLQNGSCKAVKVIDFFESIVKSCSKTIIVTKAFLATCVMAEDRQKMREFTDWRTLETRLSETDAIVEEFHGSVKPWEWCRASWIVASRDDRGNAKNVLFTVEDITAGYNEKKQYERELEASRAAAEAANKAKTDFLFNMSHDIRTPMNAIIGYADLMERHFDDTERCRDYLGKIKKSGSFLLALINNVLEMARIESGKMVLDEEVCQASDLVDKASSVYADLMERKGITFTTEVDVQTPFYYGDQVKLSEIFLNLLSNAYKYTSGGGSVSLTAKELPGNQEGFILIQTVVSDTGIGMSKDYLPKVFDEFSREYTFTENKIEGTGLGMPIVKKLVELMGGTIEAESELGKGTTFTVTLPHRISDTESIRRDDEAEIDPEKFVGKRILLAEDNELNAEIALEMLRDFGLAVDRAEDGIVCVDKLSKAQAGYYDMVLMDVQMPNLDGYGAAKRIRSLSDKEKSQIPIIAMTANAFEEDKKNAIAAGMNGHLSKPIEIQKVLGTLAEIL